MGIFKKENIKVDNVKQFLAENNINWNGAMIDAFRRGQSVYIDIDDKTFNKLISKPVRLLISSEFYKDVDVVTALIQNDTMVLQGISKEGFIDFSDKWKDFQNKAKELSTPEGYEREM